LLRFVEGDTEDMSSKKKKKILLVEDEAVIAMDEANTIAAHGYTVETAHSGEAAIDVALSDPEIDLILMDIDLGKGMDGTEAANRILRERDLPLIFLTGHTEAEMVDRAKNITNYGYIIKNSGEFVLLESINMAFKLFSAHRDMYEEKENLRVTLESIGDAVITTDTEKRITRMNTAAAELTGWPAEEAIGRPLYEVLHVEPGKEGGKLGSPDEPVLERGESAEFASDTVLRSKDGTRHRVSDSISPIRGYNGTILGMILVFRDVSEAYTRERVLQESEDTYRMLFANIRDADRQQQVERELLESNRILTTLLNNLPGMAYRCKDDPSYTMTFVSRGVRELTGYGAEELLYNRVVAYGDLVLDEDADMVWQAVQDGVARGESFAVVYRIRAKDGSVRWVWERGIGVYSDTGELEALEGFITDITERKEAEAELQRLLEEQKLILQEVHHRIKNDMNTIRSLLSLQASYSNRDGEKEALEEARRRLAIMGTIYETLYTGENVHSLKVRPFLDELIGNVIEAYSAERAVHITAEIEDIEVSSKHALPLGIIVNELLTNSYIHGFPERWVGSIRVSVGRDENGVLSINVSDDGAGPPEEILQQRTFGFGLDLVSSIVKQHDGELRITGDGGMEVSVLLQSN
jgi:PAS domain S-box-containing protein